MELLRFGVLALLCLAVAGNDATSSRSAEEYWHSIWPHTPMPKNLEYLLSSGGKEGENKDTQYPYTSFFEDDLSAGKEMNIIFNNPYANEEQKSNAMENDADKSSSSQPWGVGSWKRKAMDEASEKSTTTQPYGVFTWKRKAMDEDSEKPTTTQPYGVFTWKRKAMDEYSEMSTTTQPYGVFSWKRKAMDEDSKESTTTQPYGVSSWKRNTMVNEHDNLSLEAICNAKERFVGEDDKFCAKSVDSLLDFIISKLGKDIEALTSSFVPHQTQYTILEGVQKVSSEGVMCHKLNFEKPVFYCHQVNATMTYIVPMEAADGTRTSVVALCHRDTRGLDPHKLFHQLKVMPGTVPVCHFLGSGAISWVPRHKELKAVS